MSDAEQSMRGLVDSCAYFLTDEFYKRCRKHVLVQHLIVDLNLASGSKEVLLVRKTGEWFHSDFLPTMRDIPKKNDLANLRMFLDHFMAEGTDMTEDQIQMVAELMVEKFHPLGGA